MNKRVNIIVFDNNFFRWNWKIKNNSLIIYLVSDSVKDHANSTPTELKVRLSIKNINVFQVKDPQHTFVFKFKHDRENTTSSRNRCCFTQKDR